MNWMPYEVLENMFKKCNSESLGNLCRANDRFKLIIENSKSMMNLLCLNDAILERIFLALNEESLLKLINISSHFSRVITNSVPLMSLISIHVYDRNIDTTHQAINGRLQVYMDEHERLNPIFFRSGNIQNLIIHGKININDFTNCKKVTSLELQCINDYNIVQLHKLLDLLPELEHLNFAYPTSISGTIPVAGRKVRRFKSIKMMPNATHAFLNFCQTKSINLKFNYVQFDVRFWYQHLYSVLDFLEEQENLEEIEIEYLNFKPQIFEEGEVIKKMIINWFRNRKGLKSVIFSNCKEIEDLLKVVLGMNIEKLHINEQCCYSSHMVNWPKTLQPNPHIKQLILEGCYDDEFLKTPVFAKLLPNIRKVVLDAILVFPGMFNDDNDFPNVDDDWRNFAVNSLKLEHLEVPLVHFHCMFYGNYRFESLKTLIIGWIDFNRHDNSKWSRFAATFPNVTKLEIRMSYNLTPQLLSVFLESFPNLKELGLGFIKINAVEFVLQNPKNLKRFMYELDETEDDLIMPAPKGLSVVKCSRAYFDRIRRFSVVNMERKCYCRLNLRHWEDSTGHWNADTEQQHQMVQLNERALEDEGIEVENAMGRFTDSDSSGSYGEYY